MEEQAAPPLIQAIIDNNLQAFEQALQECKPACVNEYYNDWTPLIHAIHYGNHDMVQRLLNEGADVNKATDEEGIETPLHKAARRDNDPQMVQIILDSNPDLHKITFEGLSVLEWIQQYPHHFGNQINQIILAHANPVGGRRNRKRVRKTKKTKKSRKARKARKSRKSKYTRK